MSDQRVVDRLRDILEVPPTVTDAEIMETTRGSLLRAQVEFNVAWEDFGLRMKQAFEPVLRRLR